MVHTTGPGLRVFVDDGAFALGSRGIFKLPLPAVSQVPGFSTITEQVPVGDVTVQVAAYCR